MKQDFRKQVIKMIVPYQAKQGIEYARAYADYSSMPPASRLFYYDRNGSDCTNFVSQCVWAAYGGWVPGVDPKTVAANRERVKKHYRMTFLWYGSLFYSGSNKWCRVTEFYNYSVMQKTEGPAAYHVYEGTWENLNPVLIKEGDVIQLVVSTYAPYRFGHCLYVTEEGSKAETIKICCHSYDRLDAPLSEFSRFPDQYTKLRIIRFKEGKFSL